jgi:hypothetical protein
LQKYCCRKIIEGATETLSLLSLRLRIRYNINCAKGSSFTFLNFEREHEREQKECRSSREKNKVALIYSIAAVVLLKAKQNHRHVQLPLRHALRKSAFALEIYYILSTTPEEESSRRRKEEGGPSSSLAGWLAGWLIIRYASSDPFPFPLMSRVNLSESPF